MADRYQSLAHNPIGKFIVKNLGLPNPPVLERWSEGDPLVKGTVLIGAAPGSRLGKKLASTLKSSGITSVGVRADSKTYKGLVFDATGITDTAGLADMHQFFTPALRASPARAASS